MKYLINYSGRQLRLVSFDDSVVLIAEYEKNKVIFPNIFEKEIEEMILALQKELESIRDGRKPSKKV